MGIRERKSGFFSRLFRGGSEGGGSKRNTENYWRRTTSQDVLDRFEEVAQPQGGSTPENRLKKIANK